MLGAILRRAGLGVGCNSDEFAAESTLFSLSTAIPRPTEKRTETRLLTLLPLAKLVTENAQILCRIKNISTGGLMAEAIGEHPVGTRIYIEIGSNQRIPGEVAWTRNTNIGVKFDQNVDLRELLANRRPRNGYRPRPPRLEVTCDATVRVGGYFHQTKIHDISLGGMRVEINDWQCTGKKVVATIESLRPIAGRVRWYKNGHAGIVFDRPLGFDELAEWMGKRLEVATLKAGAWDARPR